MISKDFIEDLRLALDKFKEYLLSDKNVPEADKQLLGVILFKYGFILSIKDINKEDLSIDEQYHIDMIKADLEAFVFSINKNLTK